MARPPLRRPATAVIALLALLASLGVFSAAPPPAGAASFQNELLAAVNAHRANAGLAPVSLCQNLNGASQSYANLMAATGWFNHTGPDGSTLASRAEAAGYRGWTAIGENLAYGYPSASAVVAGWMTSPGHRDNILNPAYTHMGGGMAVGAYVYWSQMFGRSGSCGGWNPTGNLERATPAPGTVTVGGWAKDLDTTGSINVHVYVDGAGAGSFTANQARSDVGSHGFSGTVGARPGGRQVCAYGINVGPGSNQLLGCSTVWVPDPASPFWDVLSSHPFFRDIDWLDASGIAGGYPDGSFRPTSAVTRQAMAAFLWRAEGSPRGPFPNPRFSDIGTSHPFYLQIAWMKAAGLADGYSDGTFRASAVVSRQATAAFLWRLEGSPNPGGGAPSFWDVPRGSTFEQPIRWAAAQGITTGYGNGSFRPGTAVSRQAMAAFLHRWQT